MIDFKEYLGTEHIDYYVDVNGGITVKGGLDLRNTNIKELPDNLTVNGYLGISNTKITKLPDSLKVKGFLDIKYTGIKELPNNLKVSGGLYISNTKITKLPDNLTVNGDLNISYTKITKLPDNLKVDGFLDLSNTKITKLPDNLTLNDGLDLSNTDITKLPDNLTVNGFLDLSYTGITELPNNHTVNGDLYLSNTNIKELPDSLIVRGFLDISNTHITKLPDNLIVNGGLYISNTKITKLPDTLNCRSLYLDHKNITNIAYRENCGIENRTIFAVNTLNGVMVRAGCFLNTLTEFEIAVDLKYTGEAAEAYKNKARECVAELTAMLNGDKKSHLSLDLETMGIGNNSPIVSIGATMFDPSTGEIGNKFYSTISLESSISSGAIPDASTIVWWMKQSPEAKLAITNDDNNQIGKVLLSLSAFIADNVANPNNLRVWGNGPSFDNAILRSTYGRLHIPTPWMCYNDRDVRTMVELGKELNFDPKTDMPFVGEQHNALDDAIHQAKYVSAIWKLLIK